MKKFLKVYKVLVVILITIIIVILSTMVTLLGEWGFVGLVKNHSFDETVLGFIGSGCGFYLLVKFSNLATWIIETKL